VGAKVVPGGVGYSAAVCVKVRMTMCGVVGKILGGGGTARSSQPSLARLSEAQGGLHIHGRIHESRRNTINWTSSPPTKQLYLQLLMYDYCSFYLFNLIGMLIALQQAPTRSYSIERAQQPPK
jgi:hypothetical protein